MKVKQRYNNFDNIVMFLNLRTAYEIFRDSQLSNGYKHPNIWSSWNPPDLEVTIAKMVIAFLEDRRVLYAPSEMEVPEHCINSILEIRKFLTEELSKLDTSSELGTGLRAMRVSCRKFLDTVGARHDDIMRFAFHSGHWASWVFLGALGELRGVFGIHLAKIAAQYKIDIEDDLALILPAADDYQHIVPPKKESPVTKTRNIKSNQKHKKKAAKPTKQK